MFKKILLKVMCNKNGWLQAEIYPGPDGNVVWHTRGVRIVVREIHVVDVFRYVPNRCYRYVENLLGS